jgi:hypothetical protein
MYSCGRATLPEECSLKEMFLAKPRNGTKDFHLTEEWQVVGTGGEFYEKLVTVIDLFYLLVRHIDWQGEFVMLVNVDNKCWRIF